MLKKDMVFVLVQFNVSDSVFADGTDPLPSVCAFFGCVVNYHVLEIDM